MNILFTIGGSRCSHIKNWHIAAITMTNLLVRFCYNLIRIFVLRPQNVHKLKPSTVGSAFVLACKMHHEYQKVEHCILNLKMKN